MFIFVITIITIIVIIINSSIKLFIIVVYF